MLSYNELKPGIIFKYEGQPYEVLESGFLRMQQRKPVMQVKMKNLITGKVLDRNFHQSDSFEEVEIEKEAARFLYSSRGQYWFCVPSDPAKRFDLAEEKIGPAGKFIKPNSEVTIKKMEDEVVGVDVPVKIDLVVKEAPPSDRGDTASGGSKQVVLETGAIISTPMFINAGDVIRVNTQTGQYVERAEKS